MSNLECTKNEILKLAKELTEEEKKEEKKNKEKTALEIVIEAFNK